MKKYNDFELIYLIKEESDIALDIMFEKYEPLIKKICSHYFFCYQNIKIDYDDLLQEGRIGLFKAIKGYDSSQNVLFYTFATICIKRAILSFLNRNMNTKNIVLSQAIIYENDEELDRSEISSDIFSFVSDNDCINNIIKFKNSLDFIDANVFELRFNMFSYEEIANLLGLTKKNVDNRIMKIKKKLRKCMLDFA